MSERVTIQRLQQMKSSAEKIACLTSYDASFVNLQEAAGTDALLVGDSLGMVLHGDATTLNVTMADMMYHTRLVCRVRQRAIIISDMPYKSYLSPEQALRNASDLINEAGADVVKLEGGAELSETIALLTRQGISVCGHLGLLPQSIQQLGGYQVQARTEQAAEKLKRDALVLQESGADCLVLECVRSKVAAEVSHLLDIPVIGIGAGSDCDGQVLVVHDMLGITEQKYRFSKNFLVGNDSIAAALKDYVIAVKTKSFPDMAHSYE